MLQPGKMVNTHPIGDLRILLSIGTHVDESCRPAPIFISRVGEEDFGHNVVRGSVVEQPRGLASQGVFLRLIGEGKDVGRKEDRGGRLRIAGWLGKTIVEAAAPCSRNVGKNSVERDPAFL